GVTLHAAGGAEEQQRALYLVPAQRLVLASRKAIDRCVHEGQRELELRDRAPKHVEGDRPAAPYLREDSGEELAVGRRRVQPAEYLGSDRVVVAGEIEAGRLRALRRTRSCCRRRPSTSSRRAPRRRRPGTTASATRRTSRSPIASTASWPS